MTNYSYSDPLDVSIHPRLFRRGNISALDSARSHMAFQSTPAFSGEGTGKKTPIGKWGHVSIHPRLFRRGNIGACADAIRADRVSIHPRLFRRGNKLKQLRCNSNGVFQSTPAFSGEGTLEIMLGA